MFYGQCWKCGERWELGTAPTCKCPDEALASEAKKPDFWEGYVPEPVKPAQPYKGIANHINQATNGRVRIDPVTGDVGIGTPSPQPAQQEPVAKDNSNYRLDPPGLDPLYTSPPAQRTWVGLTDEEIQTEWVLTPQNDKAEGIWFGRRIETKLKEKNT